MQDDITALFRYFNRYVPFTREETETFYACTTVKTYAKKDYLLKEGEVCKHRFFITQGLVRSFYIDPKGSEQIMLFGIEHWWVTNTESFIRVVPSQLYMQALENTRVLALSKPNLEQLYVKVPKLERAFRLMTENMLMAVLKRHEFRTQLSSEENYRKIVTELPDFVQRVPQYMLASFLGVTPEHLSVLRKNS